LNADYSDGTRYQYPKEVMIGLPKKTPPSSNQTRKTSLILYPSFSYRIQGTTNEVAAFPVCVYAPKIGPLMFLQNY
jgi:hypothetical protein